MNRCKWVNLNNKTYINYHDHEWGILNTSDDYLFELLVLESFQAGLSWECVLNKREAFKEALDNFNPKKIALYNEDKINELLNNKHIIRNKLKIKAMITNAKIFLNIISEYITFYNYLCTFTKGNILYHEYKTTNTLSDTISKDLNMRGMKYVGSTIIYSYLQAIGIINDHEPTCDLYVKET